MHLIAFDGFHSLIYISFISLPPTKIIHIYLLLLLFHYMFFLVVTLWKKIYKKKCWESRFLFSSLKGNASVTAIAVAAVVPINPTHRFIRYIIRFSSIFFQITLHSILRKLLYFTNLKWMLIFLCHCLFRIVLMAVWPKCNYQQNECWSIQQTTIFFILQFFIFVANFMHIWLLFLFLPRFL